MRILGEVALLAAFVAGGYAAFACLAAQLARRTHLVRSGVAAAGAACLGLTITLAVLAWALVVKDFQFEYVAQYTSRELPWHYSLSALWVGQAGSLLLWTWLAAMLSLVYLATSRDAGPRPLVAFGILWANVSFLMAILVFAADPMKTGLAARSEGLGLSPLLQHPSMLIHPPVVFLAYAAWTIPFAEAASALLLDRLDAGWTQAARPWALFSWMVLGTGLWLGADWAYQELGWGGYWGWDPVENGSLLPWLTGTALIHALMAWRHRGGLKKLAVWLAILTFGLCNFATFLTRSGIFSSVHAFSQSPIGWMFLGLMAVLLLGGSGLVYYRRQRLVPERPLVSVLARESVVLVSVYLLLLLAAVVLAGTLYTPLSPLFAGRMVQIGPAFYNNVFLPIGVLLLAATAVVPLLRWGAVPRGEQWKAMVVSLCVAGGAAGAAAALGLAHPAAIAVTGLAVLCVAATVAGVLLDVRRRSGAGTIPAILLALRTGRRQYGGYLVHLGIACVAIGIAGSSLGTRRLEVDLDEGESIEWAGRRIENVRLVQREEPDKLVAEVELLVAPARGRPALLKPARHYHLLQDQWTTEVAIHSTWGGDFYTILHAGLGDGRVALTLIENPLMRWIWLGGGLALAGAAVAALPLRRRRTRQGGRLGSHSRLAAVPARRRAA